MVEAKFRKSLVYEEDNKNSYSIKELLNQFYDLKFNYYKLYDNYKYYSLWENLYFQTGVVIPYLVSAPQFFAGAITLGTLVQIGNAFDKIHESMSFSLYWHTDMHGLSELIMSLCHSSRITG